MTITRNTWMLVILLFVGSMAVTMLYFYTTLSGSNLESVSSEAQVQPTTLPGSLILNTGTRSTSFIAGEDVYIALSGSSAGIPIAGYDGVIMYNPNVLTFIDADNRMTTYDMFVSKKEESVTLTGSVALSSTTTSPLSDTVLAEVHFKAIQDGDVGNVVLAFTPGSKTDSNLLSDKTEDILGNVRGVGDSSREYVPDQILIAYKKNQDPQYLEKLVADRDQKRQSSLDAFIMQMQDVKVHLSHAVTPEEMLQNIQIADKKSGVIEKEFISIDPTDGSKLYTVTLNGSVGAKEAVMIMIGVKEVASAQLNNIYQPQ